MTINIYNLETNSSNALTVSNVSNSTFDSSAVNGFPSPFYASQFRPNSFIYNNFMLQNSGPGSSYWAIYDIEYGINGLTRYGIGMFYFWMRVATNSTNTSTTEEGVFNLKLWDYLTTFWEYLTDNDRDMFENYWQGSYLAANDLTSKALRLRNASAPEYSAEYPEDNYYEIVIGPLSSKPLNPDPTDKGANYIMRPIGKAFIEPTYDEDYVPTYSDLINVSASDYYKIRDVGIGCYAVVKVNKESVSDKYFKISNLFSSEEPAGRKQYAEIDERLNSVEYTGDLMYGKIAIEGLYTLDDPLYTDISQKLVQVVETSAGSFALWGNDWLIINVEIGAPNQITDALNYQLGVTPWANLINKSGKDPRTKCAVFGGVSIDEHAIKFHDLSSYKCAEAPNGRYYPVGGRMWKWYDGYGDPGTDTEGDTTKGEYVTNQSKNTYAIEVEGDLSYIGDSTFSIYLTTGRAYDVEKQVIDIPYLHTHISQGYSIEFVKDRDYTFSDYIVEFNNDIFSNGEAAVGDTLYCRKTPIIEHYLYEEYGNMVGLPDWISYNHNNYSGKTAINCALQSLQNISTVDGYHKAMNSYYGLPLAPQNGRVAGLYESYSYTITEIDRNEITLDIPSGVDLHPFIQANGSFFVEGKDDVIIESITSRELAVIKLADASTVAVGDKLSVKLRNKFQIKSVYAETETAPAYITIYCLEGPDPIQHIIDLVHETSNGKLYPEILIYNAVSDDTNYNGVYHATKAYYVGDEADSIVKIKLYKKGDKEEPLYNDYIGITIVDVEGEYVGSTMHLPWPTHKFLYIHMDNGDYFKAYLDAPMDTCLDSEDTVSKYQVLARNASVFTKTMFPGWSQFDQFRRYNGISMESDVLEVTKIFQYGLFGSYFPSNYSLNIPIVPQDITMYWQNTFEDEEYMHVQKSYQTYNERGSGLPDMQNVYNPEE
jgi:hypothetical protein